MEKASTLPIGWHPHSGLRYPLELKLKNGDYVQFKNYDEHHKFIHKLYKNYTPNE